MACVYVLYSSKLDRFYTGSCKDLEQRIRQHRNRTFARSFTSKSDDWEVYLVIQDLSYVQARTIERHIKKMKSRIFIQNLRNRREVVDRLKNSVC